MWENCYTMHALADMFVIELSERPNVYCCCSCHGCYQWISVGKVAFMCRLVVITYTWAAWNHIWHPCVVSSDNRTWLSKGMIQDHRADFQSYPFFTYVLENILLSEVKFVLLTAWNTIRPSSEANSYKSRNFPACVESRGLLLSWQEPTRGLLVCYCLDKSPLLAFIRKQNNPL
jgi:hypothetical protein